MALRCKRASARDQSCRMRDPVVRHRIRQSDMQVQPQRPGNLVGEEATQRTTGRVGSTDQLGFVPAQRDPVVPVPGPRWPRGLLGREHRRKPRRVGDIPHGWRWFQHTQSGLVAQQLPDGHIGLARLRELRPVVDDLVVVAEQSARHCQRNGKGGNTFGRGEHVDHGVVLPRRLGDSVAVAAPQVDHLDAVAIDRDRGADLATGREVGAECVGDLAVTLVDVSADQVRRHGDFQNH